MAAAKKAGEHGLATYLTTTGDTWDLIAYRTCGSEAYMPNLINANPDYAHLAVLAGGIELMVPEIDPEQSADLPPWKKDD